MMTQPSDCHPGTATWPEAPFRIPLVARLIRLLLALAIAAPFLAAQQPELRRIDLAPETWNDFAPLGRERVISVAAAGDLDHDGACDIAVGLPLSGVPANAPRPLELADADRDAPWVGEPRKGYVSKWRNGVAAGGRVMFLSSRDGSELPSPSFGWQQRVQAGFSLSSAGDFNDDGVADLLIGSPDILGAASPGCVELRSGATGTVLRRWWGVYNSCQFGWSVAQLGDLDGDGWEELAFGATERQGSGYVAIVSGRTSRTLHTLVGTDTRDKFGSCIARCGYVDADGTEDFIVGAIACNGLDGFKGWGYASVYSGKSGRLIRRIEGTNGGAAFGDAACGLGDLDDDGHADFAISAPFDPIVADSAPTDLSRPACGGAVYVYSGATAAMLGKVTGTSDRAELGSALLPVARPGDRDRSDLLIGVPGRGEVWLVSTKDFRIVTTIHEEPGFGRALAPLGDIDGDGSDDYAVGAFQYFISEGPAVHVVPGKTLRP